MMILLIVLNRDQMSYYACQVGPIVSNWFQLCIAVPFDRCDARQVSDEEEMGKEEMEEAVRLMREEKAALRAEDYGLAGSEEDEEPGSSGGDDDSDEVDSEGEGTLGGAAEKVRRRSEPPLTYFFFATRCQQRGDVCWASGGVCNCTF
jgi:hypothetical protein